ncbi:MAG: 3-deoxy-manno-octulosonate cytidylyltransferase [Flavobacteriaceae bacterium]|nr:3-deoxy-manno-octulosonate cytidylyltransferase [Flavobacteriaceae bacterium]|tara:strand:+ start:1959 stop:2699 length:741 start_codon:yes stop_codon:yes gene_type:complete
MKVIAVIPARLNSSRLPNKLLRDICGKTLIRRTYEATKNSRLFDDVLVVTNNEEILKELKNHHINFLFDKNQYQTGTDRIAAIASDINADIIINVQGDEPFIKAKTIESIINVFKIDLDKSIGIVSLMTPISDDSELNNPNNVKVITDKAGNAIFFSRYPIPFKRNINTSIAHKHIGIYAFRKETLLEFSKLNIGVLEKSEKIEALRLIENNIKIKMIISNEMFVGIDTEDDLKKAIKFFSEKDSI